MADVRTPETPQGAETIDSITNSFVESERRGLFFRIGDKVAALTPELVAAGTTLGAAITLETAGHTTAQLPSLDKLMFFAIVGATSFLVGTYRGERWEKERNQQKGGK